MKQSISSLSAFGLLISIVLAGSIAPDVAAPAPVASSDGFAHARRPISNPTLFDLALPTTNIHPIFLYHSLPDQNNTTRGFLDVGGHVELYALQAEFTDTIDIGAAYEIPLTNEDNSLMESRVTVDMVWRFRVSGAWEFSSFQEMSDRFSLSPCGRWMSG